MTDVTAAAAASAASAPVSRVIQPSASLMLSNTKILAGRLEYFPTGKSLVVFGEDGLLAQALTVPKADAPVETDALAPDEVLLRNWTDMRGAGAALANQGLVELTGREVQIGMFKLQALVARVL